MTTSVAMVPRTQFAAAAAATDLAPVTTKPASAAGGPSSAALRPTSLANRAPAISKDPATLRFQIRSTITTSVFFMAHLPTSQATPAKTLADLKSTQTEAGLVKFLRNSIHAVDGMRDVPKLQAMLAKSIQEFNQLFSVVRNAGGQRAARLNTALGKLQEASGQTDSKGEAFTLLDVDAALKKAGIPTAPAQAAAPSHKRGLKTVPDADFRILGDPARSREDRAAALERMHTTLSTWLVASIDQDLPRRELLIRPKLLLLAHVFTELRHFIDHAPVGSVAPESFWRRIAAHPHLVMTVTGQAENIATNEIRGNERITISPAFLSSLTDPDRTNSAGPIDELRINIRRLAMGAAQGANADLLASTTTRSNAPAREARRRALVSLVDGASWSTNSASPEAREGLLRAVDSNPEISLGSAFWRHLSLDGLRSYFRNGTHGLPADAPRPFFRAASESNYYHIWLHGESAHPVPAPPDTFRDATNSPSRFSLLNDAVGDSEVGLDRNALGNSGNVIMNALGSYNVGLWPFRAILASSGLLTALERRRPDEIQAALARRIGGAGLSIGDLYFTPAQSVQDVLVRLREQPPSVLNGVLNGGAPQPDKPHGKDGNATAVTVGPRGTLKLAKNTSLLATVSMNDDDKAPANVWRLASRYPDLGKSLRANITLKPSQVDDAINTLGQLKKGQTVTGILIAAQDRKMSDAEMNSIKDGLHGAMQLLGIDDRQLLVMNDRMKAFYTNRKKVPQILTNMVAAALRMRYVIDGFKKSDSPARGGLDFNRAAEIFDLNSNGNKTLRKQVKNQGMLQWAEKALHQKTTLLLTDFARRL